MSKNLTQKFIAIMSIVALLLVLQQIILGVIEDRVKYKTQAIDTIITSSSGAQTLLGPVLVFPYTQKSQQYDADKGRVITHSRQQYHYILPENLAVKSDKLEVIKRHVNIYQAQIYKGDFDFSGQFPYVDLADDFFKDSEKTFAQPYVVLVLGDTRGINHLSKFMLNGNETDFAAGAKHSGVTEGIHALIAEDYFGAMNSFSFKVALQGTNHLSIVPIGKNTTFTLNSDWAHPSFIGTILPEARSLRNDGFHAQWKSTWFANKINTYFENGAARAFNQNFPSFSVGLVELVDHYQLTMRSVKYALLFIGLTFVGFFLFEIMQRVRVHPIQYGLVGMVLVMFYLILLAFSEKVGFDFAYAFATSACSLLIGFYLTSILQSLKLSALCTLSLLMIYGVLYVILTSEGNALFLGTVFLFSVLGGIMFVTRNVNWYMATESLEFKPQHPQSEQ